MSVIAKAHQIVEMRSEEKERQYGPFSETMSRATELFNLMTDKEIDVEDMYLAMVAIKLARQAHAHKEDNLIDAIAYLGGLDNYINGK